MPRRIRDAKLRNSRPTRQEHLDRNEEEKKCPKCGTILEVDFDSEIEYCTYCDYSKGLSKRELRD